MRITVFISSLITITAIMCGALFAQNTPPVVTNVDFNMRNDGSKMVDITYDVFDAQGQTMTVTITASSDSGATWNLPITQVTGAVGSGITNGTGKTIVWNAGAEIPNFYSATVQIRITADDNYVPPPPCPGTPTVYYAGKTYNTIQIGSQCWLKENLDVGTMIGGSQNASNNNIIEKYCFNNIEYNCSIYGGLYQWNEAMQYLSPPNRKGICPEGWHIPTSEDWQILASSVSGNSNSIKAYGQGASGGFGTNSSGFSALLAGNRAPGGWFFNAGQYGLSFFYSSSETNLTSVKFLRLNYYDSVFLFMDSDKYSGFSIRCIKD